MEELHKQPLGRSGGEPPLGEPREQAAAKQASADFARATEEAKQKAKGFADDQRGLAAAKLEQLGTALRSTARTLGEENHPSMASMAEDAARRIDHLAEQLKDRDVESLVGDLRGLARRQPAVFIGGAITAGFLLARFLRSSEQEAYGPQPASTPRAPSSSEHPPAQGVRLSGVSGEAITSAE